MIRRTVRAVLAAFAITAGLTSFVRAQDPPLAPTSRPDSLRALVFDRLREMGAEPDTTQQDTTRVEAPAVGATRAPTSLLLDRPQVPEGADPLMRALLQLEGFRPATYEGTRADFAVPEGTLLLMGDTLREARFSGQGMRLDADTAITYDDRNGQIRTRGATEFSRSQGEPVSTQLLIYSLREGRGTALAAETTYREGGPWIVRGDLDSIQTGLLFGSATQFTSCLLPEPHTSFKAARLKVTTGQTLVARNVTMYVADVPVMWLPFIAQNLGSGRASGLLTPVFSINDIVRTSSGYQRRLSNLGYYWAMSEYSDLTLAFDWFASNYTAAEARMGYRWARRFLGGSLNLKRFWSDTGQKDLALSTQHTWEISERSNFRASGSYVSSSAFLRENSLDPREATQTINSDASLSRRFDWGTANFGASRRQYLSEERVEMTLPSATLALSTRTLFSAPAATARWFNNVSLSGSTKVNRRLSERPVQPDTAFRFTAASQLRTEASAGGSIGIGDLSLSGDISTTQQVFQDVPVALVAASPAGGDVRREDVSWGANLSYRLRLIGTTSLNPNVRLSGAMLQYDSIAEARTRVAAPTRVSMGAGIQADLYGLYPGFGPFEALRHKVTPSLSWSYSPEVRPTALQIAVFDPRALRRQSALTFGFNQTWEARLSEAAASRGAPQVPPGGAATPAGAPAVPGDSLVAPGDTVLGSPAAANAPLTAEGAGPTRLPPSRVVTLLALQTTAVTYDLVQADSTGRFIDGFTTTTLQNSVGSDYLRGLNLSFTHELFDDSAEDPLVGRRFSPHLSQLSASFALSERSGIVRALAGLFGMAQDVDSEAALPEAAAPDSVLVADTAMVDDSYLTSSGTGQVIPAGSAVPGQERMRREGWDARFSYSLRRPRSSGVQVDAAQMLTVSLSFAPTENWAVAWNTAYDVEAGRFNDHSVQLQRDLHEWEANFGFQQTPIGNWSFSFEVSLRANPDLHFDYEQRSLEGVQGAP